jgi:hypothetical protein
VAQDARSRLVTHLLFLRFKAHGDSMAAKSVSAHHQRTCAVEVSPSQVAAGAELTVAVAVSCPHGCDLRGQRVSIQDRDGAELASSELMEFEGDTYVARVCVLAAPVEAGEYTWRAILAGDDRDGLLHQPTLTAFSFATKAHAASVSVWGLPSAIAAGERFRLKIGVRCSAGCNLAGSTLGIFDHQGRQVGDGSLLDEVWPDTSALYFAELEARAPLTTGTYEWQVKAPGSAFPPPHAAGACRLTINVVGPPDCELTVAAFDRATQMPIEGAHILVHPYRTSTDATGVAKVKVIRGRYKLCVSGFNYIPCENTIDIEGDVATRVELAPEPEGHEDYR